MSACNAGRQSPTTAGGAWGESMAIGEPGRELFVISDLHLGGIPPAPGSADPRGFRLCTQTAELARFIALVAARRSHHAIELVINGDFVDFLAQPQHRGDRWRPFLEDPEDALRALQDIAREHPDVFDQLAAVLAAGHSLTLMLGNHDVELSFPRLRRWLHERLGDTHSDRLRFIFDGEAYTVGRLLIEHGNRYDGFNVTDHDGLRRHRSAQSRRQPVQASWRFAVPPGSQLVAELMNPLKESRFTFVDLLKPEVEAVIPLLLALEPKLMAKAARLARLRARAWTRSPASPGMPRQSGDISAATHGEPQAQDALAQWLGDILGPEGARRFMADLAGGSHGVGDMSASGRPLKLVALHLALHRLERDRSFDRAEETDKPYLDAAQALGRQGFDCIAFGHTHLAKQVPLQGGGVYLNSGTWADLIRVPATCLSADAAIAFPAIEDLLARLSGNALAGLVEAIPTYLHLRVADDGSVTQAQLRDFGAGQTALD